MLAEHKCDFVCQYVTTIDPIDTPFVSMLPKVKAPGTMHEWITDRLRPYTKWDEMLDRLTWLWRKPWGWLLAEKRHIRNGLSAWRISRTPYSYKKGPNDV